MPMLTWRKYLSAFKSFKGLLAISGVLIPALSDFTAYTPPLLDRSGLFVAAIATGTIFITNYYKTPEKSSSKRFPPLVRLAIKVLITSIILFILYLVFLNLFTVVAPESNKRFQIGFYKFEWSLTDEGRRVKATHPNETVQDWMLNDALFRPGGPDVIWKTWTIILSGLITVITFVLIFVLWTFGWALLAKQKALGE